MDIFHDDLGETKQNIFLIKNRIILKTCSVIFSTLISFIIKISDRLFSGDDIFSDCVVAGKEYTGTRDYTWKGVTCQAWSSDTPHQKTPSTVCFKMISKTTHFFKNTLLTISLNILHVDFFVLFVF